MKKSWGKVVAVCCLVVGLWGAVPPGFEVSASSEGPLTSSSPAKLRSFSDVEGHWAKSSVETSIAKGYVDGYEDGTFRPDQSVTRAEFVKMTVTAMKLTVGGIGGGGEWYLPYVNSAVGAGIHRWSDFGTGDWSTPITRLEMARMIVRATDKGLQKPEVIKSDAEMFYLATKVGLIQGLGAGVLGEQEATTRAQSVTVIERILKLNAGGQLEVDPYAVNRADLAWRKTNIFTVMPHVFGGEMYPGGTLWDPNNLRLDTPDGLWSGELEALIAIDLEDPNDPHRALLPPISELKWYKSARFPQPMEEIMPAYLLLFKSKVHWNYDPQLYPGDRLRHGISGIDDWTSRTTYDVLSGTAIVYQHTVSDLPAILLPKKLKTRGYILVDYHEPIIAPNYFHDTRVHWVKAPEWIE
ncbi:S-layer homology domain-containing protein [Paenibacillus koleovorans]|uniref:S-layer homology domain-containing protein n=1 Tax=Paenibacillus koleovorans TaxID=121608 RepID=UPI000FD70637|nr:S-layer homology domain-containing protein [Paenibacillus koleovorans]